MPQMSPMNWIMLFFSFSLIFMMLNSNNYFFIKYYFSSKMETLKLKKYNWKW
uniref:ATP synthase F0 subunit 8 n=1 Tax=Cladiscus yunnanus TaxID=3028309 RepID=UPI0023D7D93B|nr:ATP synthase F0 subunit 8 [Cladiscus yunnanus]WDE20690.1 ATP synthase F0 subunit 8 [Cladiscus yunnanus]